MKSNSELQRDVQNAISWEPLLHAAEIGVIANDGIITLTGEVDTYSKKIEAENATKNVIGVKAIVEKIEVKLPNSWVKSDSDVAQEVLLAFKSHFSIPDQSIKVKVENGWVTIDGEVAWNYQSEAAKNVITYLPGVKGVTNNIKIKTETDDLIEKRSIEEAIARNWSINHTDLKVSVSGTTVTLSGIVDSWRQKEDAARIAWNTPGIKHVVNDLEVDYYHALRH